MEKIQIIIIFFIWILSFIIFLFDKIIKNKNRNFYYYELIEVSAFNAFTLTMVCFFIMLFINIICN